jgi:flagellar biosynthetic protein FlhB
LEESQEQRTEQPTPRKLEKAREKGQVARSNELTAAFMIVGGIIALRLLFPWFVEQTSDFALKSFGSNIVVEGASDVQRVYVDSVIGLAKIMSPFLLVLLGIALVANYLQVGFLVASEPLSTSLEKINPAAGIKRLVSVQSLVKTMINAAKAALVGLVFYFSIKASLNRYFTLGDCSITEIVKFLANEAFVISMRAAAILALLGVIDYAFQNRQHIKKLKMTKHEVKEEYKELEGSPLIKSRIRSAQRELARRRMMKAVPEADVVVTNPVHLAVAIKYDSVTMGAPVVVAKGKRLLAERIKEIAADHGIPVFENRPLARSLYELVEVGAEIPESLYRAVAEVLSYVYRLKGKAPAAVAGGPETRA